MIFSKQKEVEKSIQKIFRTFFILRGYLFQRFRHFKVDTMFGPLLPQTTQAQVNSARGYVHFYKRKVYYFGWRSVKIDFNKYFLQYCWKRIGNLIL